MEQDIPGFDTLLQMAQENPYQLEQLREQLSRNTINSAPECLRPRLRGLQFQIDTKRRLAKNPLSSCIQISTMMHQSLEELRQALNGLSTPTDLSTLTTSSVNKENPFSAVILPFARNYNSSKGQMS